MGLAMRGLPVMNERLWLATLKAETSGPFMLRDVHKTNLGWSSYPFLPPTTADGILASLVVGQRWIEGDFAPARSLRLLPNYQQVATLGAYPESFGHYGRRHFRAHVGAFFNYEGVVWSAGKNIGKKLATVEEYFAERLLFYVIAPDENVLKKLVELARGRVLPFGKKGGLYFPYEQQFKMVVVTQERASANIEAIAAVPLPEIGSVGSARPFLVPVRSESRADKQKRYSVTWFLDHCMWEKSLRLREGIPVWKIEGQDQGFSALFLRRIMGKEPGMEAKGFFTVTSQK